MRTHLLKSIVKWTAIGLAVAFAILQFIRPARTNPPVDASRTIEAHVRLTPEIASILDRSCNDCHSHRTRWPWYTNISPVSWYVVGHINEGRAVLNLSDWAQYSPAEQSDLLREMCKEVKVGAMPLRSYLRLHSEAQLSSQDVKTLCDWTTAEGQRLAQSSRAISQND